MRVYSDLEIHVIQNISTQSQQTNAYLLFTAFSDLFLENNVSFIWGGGYNLKFYANSVDEIHHSKINKVKSDIITVVTLIEELVNEKKIVFGGNNSVDNGFEFPDNYTNTYPASVSDVFPSNLGDLLYRCIHETVVVNNELHFLAATLPNKVYIPVKRYNPSVHFVYRSIRDMNVKSEVMDARTVLYIDRTATVSEKLGKYTLSYFDSNNHEEVSLGDLYISFSESEDEAVIPETFIHLPVNIYSIGCKTDYYSTLVEHVDNALVNDILYALHDYAVFGAGFPRNPFEDLIDRSSLEVEQCNRLARYIVEGKNPNNAFSFRYIYRPPYNTMSSTEWNVNLSPNVPSFKRCIGVIGENGVGKTQLLCNFIKDVFLKRHENFKSEIPLYSSIVAICSTPFDAFMNIEGTDALIPYHKCCLEQNILDTESEVTTALRVISRRGMMDSFVETLDKELPTENVKSVFGLKENSFIKLRAFERDSSVLRSFIQRLSSGQLHTLMLLSYVYKHINYDTLLIVDEPEVHLHPNAILNYLRILNDILKKYSSYAIITTHSPLVVREMLGENVFVLSRLSDNTAYIGYSDHETFGENIAHIYSDIYGYDEKKSIFRDYIKSKMHKGITYAELMEIIDIENLSMNSCFTIRNMVTTNNKES